MGYYISTDRLFGLLDRQRGCVVLNSRQSKRPCGGDSWVGSTALAVEALVAQDRLFVTSLGMNTWELAVHLVNRSGGRQVIVIPAEMRVAGFDSVGEVVRSFRLDTARTSFAVLELPEDRDRGAWPHFRDSFLTSLPITQVPVSIRVGGSLDRLISSTQSPSDRSFLTHYTSCVDRIRYDWSDTPINPHFPPEWRYLTHWTRSSDGPFPGQDHFEYYASVLESAKYPGSAFHSLSRIVSEGQLRASTRFIRGEYPVVSMTSLHPREALRLMRWRQRYAYYSFEPYGIAIDIATARQCGCREVLYGSATDYEFLPEADRPFFQNAGSVVADWRSEAEWRHLGDLMLSELPEDAIRIVAYTEMEAEVLRASCPYQVVALVGK